MKVEDLIDAKYLYQQCDKEEKANINKKWERMYHHADRTDLFLKTSFIQELAHLDKGNQHKYTRDEHAQDVDQVSDHKPDSLFRTNTVLEKGPDWWHHARNYDRPVKHVVSLCYLLGELHLVEDVGQLLGALVVGKCKDPVLDQEDAERQEEKKARKERPLLAWLGIK